MHSYIHSHPSTFRSLMVRAALALVAMCLLMTVFWVGSLDAQSGVGGDVSRQDIAIRDELIAAQETLLNVYRCRFNVDTEVVVGGCVGVHPRRGPVMPGAFAGTPSQRELARRDSLVAEQESLLNAYRCRFGIDTQVVPGGCSGTVAGATLVDGVLPPSADLVSTSAQVSDEPGREVVHYVRVDYCGPSDSRNAFSMVDLRDEVKYLQTHVDAFIERQSGYLEDGSNTRRSRLVFETGYLLHPNIGNWGGESISTWYERYVDASESRRNYADPCRTESRAKEEKNRAVYPNVLILADLKTGGVVGYAAEGRGPALAAARRHHGDNSDKYTALYLETVAHEIGHAFYNLSHPWSDLFGISDSEHLNPSQVQEYLSRYSEAAQSLMSYFNIQGRDTGKKPDIRADASEHARAYIACYQRQDAGWHVGPDCEFPVLTPETPDPPTVTPGNGQVIVSWRAPNDRGAQILEYYVQYQSEHSSAWIDVDWEFGAPLETTIRGLTNGTEHFFRVRAENRVGKSKFFSAASSGTPQVGRPPTVTLRVGDSAQGARGADGVCSSVHCRWLHIEIQNLGPGPHTLACAHNGVEQIGAQRGVYKSDVVTGSTATRSCLFGYPGAEVFVIVGAEHRGNTWYGGTSSNVVVWPHAESTDEPDEPTSPPNSEPTPTVRLSKGRNAQNVHPGCTSPNCHFMRVELVDFEPGTYTVHCGHHGVPSRSYSPGIWESYSTSKTVSQYCIWGFTDRVYVDVEDPTTGVRVRSNDAQWP